MNRLPRQGWKIHGYWQLVGKEKLEQAWKALQQQADEINASKTFDKLLTLVEDCTSSMDRFGILAVYDKSLWLGAHLSLCPEVVYMDAGINKGYKAPRGCHGQDGKTGEVGSGVGAVSP